MRRKIGFALALLGASLLLDTTFSWLAFCDPGYGSEPYNYRNDEECSAFRGPLVQSVIGFRNWIGAQFRDPNDVIAFFTIVLAISTIGLWVSTHGLYKAGEAQRKHSEDVAARQASEMHASITEARRAADVAERSLIATQRAWIKARITPGVSLHFGTDHATLNVNFEFTNIGQAPAVNIRPMAWLMVSPKDGFNLEAEMKQRSDEMRANRGAFGFTLFPGDTFPEVLGLGGYAMGVSVTDAEIQKGLFNSPRGDVIMLYVMGVVDYTYPADPDGHHQTAIIYEVRRADFLPIRPAEGSLRAEELRFVEFPMGSLRAD